LCISANVVQKALNLFNAALVTPTYYVFFTSATIVTSAILFRGFKGTPATISTVIMGFLQICAGVVLLQLSKSAKDVPDAAVFKGDLDQVRTVAEQEEPEYEPRADTIRGGASILRSLSRSRTIKQLEEVKRLQEETMTPIGENEHVEFDGLRRRRTFLDPNHPGRTGTVVRRNTLHPPLGMSHFPSDDEEDEEYHPGFFQRLRARGKSTNTAPPAVNLSTIPRVQTDGTVESEETEKGSYKPAMQEDTSYKPQHETTIHFADEPQNRQSSRDSLHPPRPPLHTAKRQFSFQNVFFRHRSDASTDSYEPKRPASSSRKSSHNGSQGTEEERLGLVKGDSSVLLPIPSHDSRTASPPRYSESPDHISQSAGTGVRRIDSDTSIRDFDYEKRGTSGSSGRFL
jgi:hypothetical protein